MAFYIPMTQNTILPSLGVAVGTSSHIPIHTIDSSCHTQRGFDSRGCFGTNCHDACCQYGADVDLASYALIKQHASSIGEIVHSSFDAWFESSPVALSSDFLGGGSVRSRVGNDGYCVFHIPDGKGCALYQLAFSGIDKEIVPSICRLYPLSWDDGVLRAATHLESTCNCVADPGTLNSDEFGPRRSILETQIEDVKAIFQFDKLYTIVEPRRKEKVVGVV